MEEFADCKNYVLSYLPAVPSFGENVKRLRLKAGLKANQLAEKLGVTPPVVSAWENDRTGLPEGPTLLKFAKALECNVDELLYGIDPAYEAMKAGRYSDVDDEHIDVSGHVAHDLPVIAEGEASPDGNLFWDDEGKLQSEVEDRITRPFDVKDPRAYGVRVRGDSMVPTFRPKMVVVVSPSTPVGDGDAVYVQLLSGERLIKVARRITDGWLLESNNPAYAARVVKHEEVGAIHPIVWVKFKESGRRLVDDVKRAVERRVTERRGRVKERHEPSVENPDDVPVVARDDDWRRDDDE